MASLNNVLLVGRLGAEPELRSAEGKSPFATMRLATNRVWNDRASGERKEHTEWHRIVTYGRTAENCAKYLGKGSLVCIEGRLTTRTWDDRDGNKRQTTEVRARRVQFLDRRPPDSAADSPPQSRPTRSSGAQPVADDDIPF